MNKLDRIKLIEELQLFSCEQIDWLESIGFFTAPASTRWHGNYEGGLFDHSYETAKALVYLTEKLGLEWQRKESPWIVGLFHDLCKCDAYNEDNGNWVHSDRMLLKGHGDKSVMVAAQLMPLTEEEVLCIRYHMGAYETDDWNEFDRAIRKHTNVLWTHTADMMASKIVGV